jgi:glutathione S-transferase
MIVFYGAPASSAGRTHLMLEESGVPYEYHQVNLRDPASKEEFLKINPNGRVPYLIDGDFRMQESIAINFYIAENHAPQLWANNAHDRAQIYAWSLWAITNLESEVMRFFRHTYQLEEAKRSAHEAETGKTYTAKLLDELERALPASGYLVAERITVADINVASVVNLAAATKVVALAPKSQAWLTSLKERPAWQKVAKAG